MSQENVELVRGAFERFLAGGSDFGVELLDPQVERDATEHPVPELAVVYRGVAAVQQFWREWLSAWETVAFEYELLDAGDPVLALIDQRMRGRSTGIEVSVGEYAHLYTFRNGSALEGLPQPIGGPRSRGASGVGDVAGERGDRAARRRGVECR